MPEIEDHEMKMRYELKVCPEKEQNTMHNEITLTMACRHIKDCIPNLQETERLRRKYPDRYEQDSDDLVYLQEGEAAAMVDDGDSDEQAMTGEMPKEWETPSDRETPQDDS